MEWEERQRARETDKAWDHLERSILWRLDTAGSIPICEYMKAHDFVYGMTRTRGYHLDRLLSHLDGLLVDALVDKRLRGTRLRRFRNGIRRIFFALQRVYVERRGESLDQLMTRLLC